jgi:Family of unknown function (DUF5677)
MSTAPFETEFLDLVRDILDAMRASLDSLRGKSLPLPTAKYLFFSAQHVIDLTAAYVTLRESNQKYASCQLIRSALEGMYRFEAVLKRPSILYRVGISEHEEDRKLLRAFKAKPEFPEYTKNLEFNWEAAKKAFQEAFPGETLSDTAVSVWDLADIAGRSSDYECFYRYYSQFSHAALRANGQTFVDFSYLDGPTMANIGFVILEGLRTLGALIPDIDPYHQRFSGLYSQIESETSIKQSPPN